MKQIKRRRKLAWYYIPANSLPSTRLKHCTNVRAMFTGRAMAITQLDYRTRVKASWYNTSRMFYPILYSNIIRSAISGPSY